MNNLKNEIHDYWTNRARGYSEYNQQELVVAPAGIAARSTHKPRTVLLSGSILHTR